MVVQRIDSRLAAVGELISVTLSAHIYNYATCFRGVSVLGGSVCFGEVTVI